MVNYRLRNRGIQCDVLCPRCGIQEETINRVLFECPTALQTWSLSNIPWGSDVFTSSSVFANMDYLFSRLPNELIREEVTTPFPWIIWYIWKARNDNLFKNIDPQYGIRGGRSMGTSARWAPRGVLTTLII